MIDTGHTITQELTRIVPTDDKYIIIIDDLKNSTVKKQQYFIPYQDFIKRYTIDGTTITSDMSSFETTTVQAKGIITGFECLYEDSHGDYKNPSVGVKDLLVVQIVLDIDGSYRKTY